jgi:hypothetical protein
MRNMNELNTSQNNHFKTLVPQMQNILPMNNQLHKLLNKQPTTRQIYNLFIQNPFSMTFFMEI